MQLAPVGILICTAGGTGSLVLYQGIIVTNTVIKNRLFCLCTDTINARTAGGSAVSARGPSSSLDNREGVDGRCMYERPHRLPCPFKTIRALDKIKPLVLRGKNFHRENGEEFYFPSKRSWSGFMCQCKGKKFRLKADKRFIQEDARYSLLACLTIPDQICVNYLQTRLKQRLTVNKSQLVIKFSHECKARKPTLEMF